MSIFRDKSTRTRYAFRSGCNTLGLMTEELDESTSQIAHGETVRETAAMIAFLSEVIGIRDDMFLGEGHKYMVEVAASLDESYREGVIAQRPAVVNLQCDLDHPTQSMADPAPHRHLRGRRAPAWQEARDDVGVLAELRQAAVGATGRRDPHGAHGHGCRARASRGLRPGG
jgi:ornithine carbamoyltransferase